MKVTAADRRTCNKIDFTVFTAAKRNIIFGGAKSINVNQWTTECGAKWGNAHRTHSPYFPKLIKYFRWRKRRNCCLPLHKQYAENSQTWNARNWIESTEMLIKLLSIQRSLRFEILFCSQIRFGTHNAPPSTLPGYLEAISYSIIMIMCYRYRSYAIRRALSTVSKAPKSTSIEAWSNFPKKMKSKISMQKSETEMKEKYLLNIYEGTANGPRAKRRNRLRWVLAMIRNECAERTWRCVCVCVCSGKKREINWKLLFQSNVKRLLHPRSTFLPRSTIHIIIFHWNWRTR